MTACAMTVGMVPMALALERGSQMQAPLGRAVIGGLVMSTFATLLVLPSIFALVIGRSEATLAVDLPGRPREHALRPAGLRRRGPGQATASDGTGTSHDGEPTAARGGGRDHTDDEVLGFLRQILDEARSKRHDMVTHYTVDDLRVALGFAKASPATGDPAPDARSRARREAADGPERPATDRSQPRALTHADSRGDRSCTTNLDRLRGGAVRRLLARRSSMRRSLGPTCRSVPPAAACSPALCWPPSRRRAAATRRRRDYTSVSKPPTVRLIQPAGPDDRPGRRPAELHRELRAHVDLSRS